jgi:hypothetical protein
MGESMSDYKPCPVCGSKMTAEITNLLCGQCGTTVNFGTQTFADILLSENDELAAILHDMLVNAKSHLCAFCGVRMPDDCPDVFAAMKAHIIDCPKHPIREVLVENERLRKELDTWKESHGILQESNKRLGVENSRLTDWCDLMIDEFKRIRASDTSHYEIRGLCDRAIGQTRQRVPVIDQWDLAEGRASRLKIENEDLRQMNADLRKCIENAARSTFQRPPIVCLCGSTRFFETFQEISLQETLAGKIVLSIGCNLRSDRQLWADPAEREAIKKRLDELHLRKIDLANEVLILNVGGYIGDSTRKELEYAIARAKAVRFLEPIEAKKS